MFQSALSTGKKMLPGLLYNFFLLIMLFVSQALHSCCSIFPFENENKDRSLAFLYEDLSGHL